MGTGTGAREESSGLLRAQARAGLAAQEKSWSLWRLLDPGPAGPRWGWVESLVLGLWCAVTAFAVHQHTPWADEMQAWLLAGEVSWKTLFVHSLHYEGTGGLWHATLKLLQAAGFSFAGMRWFAAGVEGAAMAVLLRYAPLPPLVRWLLPFTFFLLYQDGVVARSYCLFAMLVFVPVVLLRGARVRAVLLAGLLGLLANVSLHGVVAALGLALAAAGVWRGRWLRNVPAMALLVVLFAAAAVTMAPARDIDYGAGNNLQRSFAKIERSLGLQATPPPALGGLPMAGLPAVPAPVHVRSGYSSVWNRTARLLAVITFPLATVRSLALLLAALVGVQAVLAGRGAGGALGGWALAPWLLMVVAFTTLYLAPRHTGTVLTGFVATAWLSWPAGVGMRGGRLWLARAAAGVFAVVCVLQIGWTVHALVREHRLPYAPGQMVADFLKAHGVGQPGPAPVAVAGYYYLSIDPLLYFPSNIYFNQPAHRYWYWSTEMLRQSTVRGDLARHPAYVVIGGFSEGPDEEVTRDWEPMEPRAAGVPLNDTFLVRRYWLGHGYRVTHVFCGHSWMRNSYAELLCDTVLEPVG